MSREPWFLAPERCIPKAKRRAEEQGHITELSFALESKSWFVKEGNDCV